MFQIFVLFTAPISAINSNPSGVYNGASLPFAIKRYLSKKMPFSKHSHQRTYLHTNTTSICLHFLINYFSR